MCSWKDVSRHPGCDNRKCSWKCRTKCIDGINIFVFFNDVLKWDGQFFASEPLRQKILFPKNFCIFPYRCSFLNLFKCKIMACFLRLHFHICHPTSLPWTLHLHSPHTIGTPTIIVTPHAMMPRRNKRIPRGQTVTGNPSQAKLRRRQRKPQAVPRQNLLVVCRIKVFLFLSRFTYSLYNFLSFSQHDTSVIVTVIQVSFVGIGQSSLYLISADLLYSVLMICHDILSFHNPGIT